MKRLTIELTKHYAWGNRHNTNVSKNKPKYCAGSKLASTKGSCCLGFIGMQIEGIPERNLWGVGTPSGCSWWNCGMWKGGPRSAYGRNSELTNVLINLNDGVDDKRSYAKRMEELKGILSRVEIDLSFTLNGEPHLL